MSSQAPDLAAGITVTFGGQSLGCVRDVRVTYPGLEAMEVQCLSDTDVTVWPGKKSPGEIQIEVYGTGTLTVDGTIDVLQIDTESFNAFLKAKETNYSAGEPITTTYTFQLTDT